MASSGGSAITAGGTIATSATATFAVPSGWVGNIAINDAQFSITTDSTLIEANFNDWHDGMGLRADVDVSYV
jgi:hypothetical protein